MYKKICNKVISILFKIQGFLLKNIELKKNKITLEVENIHKPICPVCGRKCSIYDSKIKKIKVAFLLGREIYMKFRLRRVKCKKCNRVLTEHLEFVDSKKSYSVYLGEEIIRYTKKLDNKSVAKITGMSESSIYRIDKDMLSKKHKNYVSKLPEVRKMSIDEVAYKRGHNYLTVFTDNERSKVIWVEKGRKCINCLNGLSKLSSKLTNLEVVSMDLWKAYEKAVKYFFKGEVTVVFDKFHISRLLNKAVEEERRVYQKELSLQELVFVKKKMRWIILKRYDKLDLKGKEYIEKLKKLNSPLYEIYLLKEEFLSIFSKHYSVKEGLKMLINWTNTVLESNFKYLKRFAKKVIKKLDKLLNWFKYPISNGKSEGINNVIKTLLKRGYGYKDTEYLKLKILQIVGDLQ